MKSFTLSIQNPVYTTLTAHLNLHQAHFKCSVATCINC